jgi:uncharacterized RDD family membrane protein YckC
MERGTKPQDFVLGVVVITGRAGLSVGRLALRSARVVTRTPVAGPALGRGVQGVAGAGERGRRRLEASGAEEVVERAVDRALAGPLPEAVARSLAERRVVERVAAEVLAHADLERAVSEALGSEATERLVQQVLASPAFERLLLDALESRLVGDLTQRVLASPELERTLEQVMSSAAVRRALTRQTTSLADEVADGVRDRAVSFDDAAERGVRRLFHRSPRVSASEAGIGTRGIALVIDLVLAHLIYLVGAATVALVVSIVGELRPTWLFATLAAAGWLLVVAVYFVLFWSTTGQTPGMRLMRLRVTDRAGAGLNVGRALVRLVGLELAIIPLFAGFIPILFDDRRRGLADFLAGTVVVYERDAAVLAAEVDVPDATPERRVPDAPPGLTQP